MLRLFEFISTLARHGYAPSRADPLSIAVIGTAGQNGCGAVDLFRQHDPH